MTVTLANHWQMMLAAAAVGLALGAAFVAVSCLAPLVRLHLAGTSLDPARRACVLRTELRHLRRLGDAAAVLEEHDRPGAKELRAEAGLRTLLLLRGLHRTRGGNGWR